MNATERTMLIIQSLDPAAHVNYSQYTRQWYVSAHINVSDGAVLGGITQHRDSPEEAIAAYMDEMTSLDLDHYLVSEHYGKYRREWRWNGAAFLECTRPEVIAAQS